jgi:LPXTG-motif cell wall-anchored protein
MKRIFILILMLLTAGLAGGYEYRMPVNIQSSTNPAVLMPGDEAILTIQMQNGAAAYGVGRDAGVSSSSNVILSTPINHTTLHGTTELEVIDPDSYYLGMIGPNDSFPIYYKILAGDNVSSGTYLLDFEVQGGYDMITIKREIPIKVDSSTVSMAIIDSTSSTTPSATPAAATLNLNVANPRENTLNAVTIVPSAQGLRFSPERYYIGTMDADEVFTISFGVQSVDPVQRSGQGASNISFVAEFKNGDTWHSSEPYITTYSPPMQDARPNNNLLPLAIGALGLLAAAGYLYRKKRQE